MIDREKNFSILLAKLLVNINVDRVVLHMCGMGESETLFDITRLCRKEFHMNSTPFTPKLKHVLKLFCHKYFNFFFFIETTYPNIFFTALNLPHLKCKLASNKLNPMEN